MDPEIKKWIAIAKNMKAAGMSPEKVESVWGEFMDFIGEMKALGYSDLKHVKRALKNPKQQHKQTEENQLAEALNLQYARMTDVLEKVLKLTMDGYEPTKQFKEVTHDRESVQ